MPRLYVVLAALTLAACQTKTGDEGDTDVVGNDDVVNDTDVIGEDTDVIDEDTDTTDTDVGPLFAKIPYVHAGIYSLGATLHFRDVIVTAVRYRTTPPASNGVVVQDPEFDDNAGIYVDLDNTQNLPEIGDVVEFIGVYMEDPIGGIGVDALSTIVVDPVNPAASMTTIGTAELPAPVVMTLADVNDASVAETFECMRVHIDGPLDVVTNLNGYGEVKVALNGAGPQALVSPRFFDLVQSYPDLEAGDGMSALEGILFWERSAYKIATTQQEDAFDYTAF